MYIWFCFFFFKQKTAYEMRISDWSSDVCSSDLYKASGEWEPVDGVLLRGGFQRAIRAPSIGELFAPVEQGVTTSLGNNFDTGGGDPCDVRGVYRNGPNGAQVAALRSEEHTSELQSLMRISYAVFCLKKKIIC